MGDPKIGLPSSVTGDVSFVDVGQEEVVEELGKNAEAQDAKVRQKLKGKETFEAVSGSKEEIEKVMKKFGFSGNIQWQQPNKGENYYSCQFSIGRSGVQKDLEISANKKNMTEILKSILEQLKPYESDLSVGLFENLRGIKTEEIVPGVYTLLDESDMQKGETRRITLNLGEKVINQFEGTSGKGWGVGSSFELPIIIENGEIYVSVTPEIEKVVVFGSRGSSNFFKEGVSEKKLEEFVSVLQQLGLKFKR